MNTQGTNHPAPAAGSDGGNSSQGRFDLVGGAAVAWTLLSARRCPGRELFPRTTRACTRNGFNTPPRRARCVPIWPGKKRKEAACRDRDPRESRSYAAHSGCGATPWRWKAF